jgi:hypothetical protein
MPPDAKLPLPFRFAVVITILVATLLIGAGLGAVSVLAEDHPQPTFQKSTATRAPTATRAKKPEKPLSTIFTVPRLCGQLVYLTEYETGVGAIGLKPCDRGGIFVFRRHPRDLVPFYQIRNARVVSGEQLKTDQYGTLDLYITTFKNYVGIESCDQCGMYMQPPTWTAAPLTPFTLTPRTPPPTLYIPSSTSTDTPTLAPWQVTATPRISDLLFGTNIPTGTPTVKSIPSPSSMLTSDADLPAASARATPWNSPLVWGIGLLLLFIGIAYLAWLTVMRMKQG